MLPGSGRQTYLKRVADISPLEQKPSEQKPLKIATRTEALWVYPLGQKRPLYKAKCTESRRDKNNYDNNMIIFIHQFQW